MSRTIRSVGIALILLLSVVFSGCGQAVPLERSEYITIGGIKQYVQLAGPSKTKPIVLFIHGGPGSPDSTFSREFLGELEENFIVVNWDQRGAGKSYSPDICPETMTIEYIVQDTLELIDFLLEDLAQDKLYLVGFSWGSIIGLKVAEACPDKLHAYIGIGQVASMPLGEELSYTFTLTEAKRLGNQEAVEELESIGPPPYANLTEDIKIQRKWVAEFGGNIHNLNDKLRNLKPFDQDMLAQFLEGHKFSTDHLLPEMMGVDFLTSPPSLRVPVFFCSGKYDYVSPAELAYQLYQGIGAPHKEFIWFEQSGHNPQYEEPEEFINLIQSIIGQK